MKDLVAEVEQLDKGGLYEFQIDNVTLQDCRIEFLLTITNSNKNLVLSRWRVTCNQCQNIVIDRSEISRDFCLKYDTLMIGKSGIKGSHFSATKLGVPV
ncbi:hypothetical protein [Photobacterium damselae]|uniref:hypothetical protein n=1 Tax=Photobacterium damselae TaxID=38293 RepID=UPI001EFDAE95|nr:hypothetical protein [Photobacterium damselae]MCG9705015.1 hypothetical protein [Photobacterium damselae]